MLLLPSLITILQYYYWNSISSICNSRCYSIVTVVYWPLSGKFTPLLKYHKWCNTQTNQSTDINSLTLWPCRFTSKRSSYTTWMHQLTFLFPFKYQQHQPLLFKPSVFYWSILCCIIISIDWWLQSGELECEGDSHWSQHCQAEKFRKHW